MRAAVRRRVSIGILVAVALLGALPASGAGSVISGRLTGTPVPAKGAGEAIVRAVDAQTGRIVASAVTDPRGRYRFTVPKGAYVLLPTVVAPGRPLVRPAATRVRVARGQRKAVTIRAGRKRATQATVSPIVGIRDGAFTGGTGDVAVLNRAMGEMLVTEIVGANAGAGCTITVVEAGARFEAAYQAELRLARSGLVDPATAIRPGLRIRPTRGIRGRISVTGDRMTISAEVYRWSNNRTLGRASVEGPADRFFDLEAALVPKLVDLLCERPPPIAGQFSGSVDYSKLPVAPVDIRISWEGAVELVPQTTIGGVPIPARLGMPVTYRVRSGTLTGRISGSTGDCTISGQGSFSAAGLNGGPDVLALSITEGDPDTYRLFMGAGSAALDTVLSNCVAPEDNGRTGKWPLLAVALMDITKAHEIVTEGVFSGSGSRAASGADGEYAWNWSFRQ
ncbi:MAG: carboxypeptidase regulatory-like domain-containing protein [Thermoleophilia bacterium]|nr:carboxypeptidase regulatory-like domain-containing protein [Thermoleophilia bacterium]